MDDSPIPVPPSKASVSERMKRAFEARSYELLSELGRGGMGVVYLAQHKKLGRRVALKTLTPDRQTKESSILRFQREARTFAQIRHPHIATLYEYEDTGPIQYLALEYVEGTDLEKERRKRRQWSPKEVGEIIASVADALTHTHEKQILHRDIKPGNILIENGTLRTVLTDFGLAKGEQDDTLTQTGFAVGTPAYMAPEQITDQFGTKPDGRSDLFSLATVAYEMLTHEHPFLAPDDLNTMRNIVNKQAKPLLEVNPNLPERLCFIVEKMLQKNPKDRYPDAKIVYKELRAWLENPTSPAPARSIPSPAPPPISPTPKSSNKPPMGTANAAQNAIPPTTVPPPKNSEPVPSGVSKATLIAIIAAGIIVLILGIVIGAILTG